MTIPSTTRKAGPLLGTGSQTAWPFTFKVFAEGDVAVTIADAIGVETLLVLDTDYSVALNANQETSPGGTVTYPISGTALSTGSVLTIAGDLDYDQALAVPTGGNFNPTTLERQLDRMVMQIQQLREQLSRAVRVGVTSDAEVTLPAPVASNIIGWDATASALENYPLSELATAVAFATYRYDTFVGDGVEDTFVLSADPVTLGNIDVSLDGITYVPGVDHSLVGTSLVFTTPPLAGVEILARYGQGLGSGLTGSSSDISYLPSGGVERTVESKLRDVVGVGDFATATAAAAAVATAGTGTVVVPNNASATLPTTYVETVFDYQSQQAHNVYSESDSGRLAKKLLKSQHGAHTGTQQVGVFGIEHRPTGSGFNGAANADIGINLSVVKKNYLTTTEVGEIDGLNIAVRNGGAASSDCAGILVDIANLSGSGFMAAFEAASTTQNSSGVTQKSMQTQVGVIDSVTSVSVGFVGIATAGTVNDGVRLLSSGTGNWENFLRFIDTAGVSVFKVDQFGRIILTAASGATPSKTIRSLSGSLSILDDAGTTQIFTLTDAGGLSLTGGISVAGGVTGAQLIATSAATAAAVGTVRYGSTVSSAVGAAGGASALPATPLGYIIINVAGTSAKVPYYTA